MPELPSRRAVALRYEPTRDRAPVVVATGSGLVADAILQRARDAGVAVREDPALAEALRALELGGAIPEELFGAVAEVLVWSVSLDRRARGQRLRAVIRYW